MTIPAFRHRFACGFFFACILLAVVGQSQDVLAPMEGFDPSVVLRVRTVKPRLNESYRPWVSRSGKNAVVARLAGREGTRIIFDRADGKRIVADPNSLSIADRVYALQQTESRVDMNARVLLGKIIAVRDGDTIQIETIGNETVTVRLDGIDAPEKRQDYGKVSLEWLARFIGYSVRIEFMEEDRYRRILGQIYVGDRWVNYEMILAGMAWHYDAYNSDRQLAGAHTFAKEARRGIWIQDELIAPWDYRNGVRKKTQEPMNVASIRETDTVVYVTESGNRYHTGICRYAKKNGIPMPLSRASSAYDRCSICKPPTVD